MAQGKKRVFVSFEFDKDKALKDFIVGQSRLPDSPFEVADWPMKEAAPDRSWPGKARQRIRRSDIVVVMVGASTYKAPGVLKEVQIAREEGKRVCQIIGYTGTSPTRVPGAGRLLAWNWENLKMLFRSTPRRPAGTGPGKAGDACRSTARSAARGATAQEVVGASACAGATPNVPRRG